MAKFWKGMVLAVNVIPSEGADSPSIMIIDTGSLNEVEEEDAKWLAAMKEELEKDLHPESQRVYSGQQTYPGGWDCLEKAEMKNFPISIDGVVDLFYE